MAALGLNAQQPVRLFGVAYDNYFTGDLTDAIEGMTYTPAVAALTPPFGVPRRECPWAGTAA